MSTDSSPYIVGKIIGWSGALGFWIYSGDADPKYLLIPAATNALGLMHLGGLASYHSLNNYFSEAKEKHQKIVDEARKKQEALLFDDERRQLEIESAMNEILEREFKGLELKSVESKIEEDKPFSQVVRERLAAKNFGGHAEDELEQEIRSDDEETFRLKKLNQKKF